jgi:hypothetical protein
MRLKILSLLPLLSIATSAGAQASVAPDASINDVARATGAAAPADDDAQSTPTLPRVKPVRDYAYPIPPKAIDLSCPLNSGFARRVDLSTGGTADWRLLGATGLPPISRAHPIEAEDLPAAWNIPMGTAKWVQAKPADMKNMSIGPYVFTTLFRVLKSPGEMRVTLKGRVLADEKFSVELFEPEPETGPHDHPSQWGGNGDDPNPAQLTSRDVYFVDMLVGEAVFQSKPSGSKNPRVGTYAVRVTVENSAGFANAVAMVAQLELTQTCLNWGKAAPQQKRKKKK